MDKTTAEPLLSIIIPTYNAAEFLPDAVACIRAQTYQPPLEIIIVDDGSTDDTAEIAPTLDPAVRYIYQENSSPAAARNRGLQAARGEIIAFLDADDLFPPNKFELQLRRLQNDPTIDAVHGRIKYITMAGGDDRSVILDEDGTINFIHIGAALFRKSVFAVVGSFDEDLRYTEDHDIFIRLRENNIPFVILNEVTLLYRLHDKNMTNDKSNPHFQILKVLKKSIDRRQKKHPGVTQQLPKFSDFLDNEETAASH